MANLENIRKRLAKLITEKGHTYREISLKIGRKDSYIQQYIKYGFPKRLNELDRKKICQILNIQEDDLIDDDLLKSDVGKNLLSDIRHKTDIEDYICINIHDSGLQKSLEPPIIGRMAFKQKEFYGWFTSNPEHLKMLRINTDSMEPLIPNGSIVMYDSSIQEYICDGLYILFFDNQLMLRRLQSAPNGKYIVKSENPRYQDFQAEEYEIEILGRAVTNLISRSL